MCQPYQLHGPKINPVVGFGPMRSINSIKLVQNSLRGKKKKPRLKARGFSPSKEILP